MYMDFSKAIDWSNDRGGWKNHIKLVASHQAERQWQIVYNCTYGRTFFFPLNHRFSIVMGLNGLHCGHGT